MSSVQVLGRFEVKQNLRYITQRIGSGDAQSRNQHSLFGSVAFAHSQSTTIASVSLANNRCMNFNANTTTGLLCSK